MVGICTNGKLELRSTCVVTVSSAWYRDGHLLQNTSSFSELYGLSLSGELRIRNLTLETIGYYTCLTKLPYELGTYLTKEVFFTMLVIGTCVSLCYNCVACRRLASLAYSTCVNCREIMVDIPSFLPFFPTDLSSPPPFFLPSQSFPFPSSLLSIFSFPLLLSPLNLFLSSFSLLSISFLSSPSPPFSPHTLRTDPTPTPTPTIAMTTEDNKLIFGLLRHWEFGLIVANIVVVLVLVVCGGVCMMCCVVRRRKKPRGDQTYQKLEEIELQTANFRGKAMFIAIASLCSL